MKKICRLSIVGLVAVLAWAAPAAAGDVAEARKVVSGAIHDALTILRDPQLQAAEARAKRIRKLRAVADRVFDWRAMARSSLGPQWRKLGDDQRARFSKLLEERLADSYLDDIDKFQGDEQVKIEGARKSGDDVEVQTTLITHSGDEVPMSYRAHQTDGSWLVHDFSIEGVSMVNHYRSSFRRFLVNHSFEELMARLSSRR